MLRRAQTPEDRLAGIPEMLGDQLASYEPGLVRRLAPAPSGGFYLIAGVTPKRKPVPAACLKALSAIERRRIQRIEAYLLGRAGQPAYCIMRVTSTTTPRDQTTNTQTSCSPFAQVASVFALAGATHGNHRSVWGLAPDGVTAVNLRFRSDPAIAAAVTGNFFLGRGSAAAARAAIKALTGRERRLSRGAGHGRARPTAAQRRAVARLLPKALLVALPSEVDWLDSTGATVTRFAPPSGPPDLLEFAATSTSSSSSSTTSIRPPRS